jgi:hypothetical protein
MKRLLALAVLAVTLAGCAEEGANPAKLDLGDFTLGHNIVVAPDLQKGPTSRNATPEELTDAVKTALDKRLGRYEGDRLVHLGVNVSGYILARPGVPLVYTPKSAFVITVSAWDDREGKKFNEKPRQMTILENLGKAPIIGTGHTMTREEQIEHLAENTARAIEKWLAKNGACMTENPTEEVLAACWTDPERHSVDN